MKIDYISYSITYRAMNLSVVVAITFEGLLELGFKVGFMIETMTGAKSDMMGPKYGRRHDGVLKIL